MRVVPFFERASLIGGQNRRHQNRHFGFFDLVLACTQIPSKSEVSFMIITLTLSHLNICADEIHPIKQEEFELLRSLGLVTKRNKTYVVSLHYRDYRLICPVLKTGDGAMAVLWPSFKLPRRRYPVFVYLYAVARYLSTDLSMRAVAAEVRKKFGLTTFSHTTLSRTLRKLAAEVDEIAAVGQTLSVPCSCVPLMSRRHWTEEKRRTYAKLLDVLSPVLASSAPDQGNRLAYLFYNRYGRFLL